MRCCRASPAAASTRPARPPAPPTACRPTTSARPTASCAAACPRWRSSTSASRALLRSALFNFMRRSAEISVGPVQIQKYGEFVRNLPVPTNLNLVHMKPLRGTALFVFDPKLVFLVVDNLFGGDGRFHTRVEGRDFTQTEQRIIQRLLDLVLRELRRGLAAGVSARASSTCARRCTASSPTSRAERGGGHHHAPHRVRPDRRLRCTSACPTR